MATRIGTYGADTIFGGSGVDLIYGRDGNDALYGLAGNDTITGGYGADQIFGGSGSDTASYHDSYSGVSVFLASGSGFGGSAAGDTLHSIENVNGSFYDDFLAGDDGANRLGGYSGNDTLKGGGGADLLSGGEGDDTLIGGTGSDTLNGGLGIDNMSGGAGDDVYSYVESWDLVTEAAGEGYDVVYSAAHAYTLGDNFEVLALNAVGSRGVYGTGNAQANTIFGNIYDNVLNGGGSADVLSGLGGNDTFVFRPGQAHGDTIYEFNGNGAGTGDVLRFEGYGSIAQGATFRQFDATHWEIASADGLTHDIITLVGGPTIDASDFMFA